MQRTFRCVPIEIRQPDNTNVVPAPTNTQIQDSFDTYRAINPVSFDEMVDLNITEPFSYVCEGAHVPHKALAWSLWLSFGAAGDDGLVGFMIGDQLQGGVGFFEPWSRVILISQLPESPSEHSFSTYSPAQTTLAHEIGHLMGLGEEYSREGLWAYKSVNPPSKYCRFDWGQLVEPHAEDKGIFGPDNGNSTYVQRGAFNPLWNKAPTVSTRGAPGIEMTLDWLDEHERQEEREKYLKTNNIMGDRPEWISKVVYRYAWAWLFAGSGAVDVPPLRGTVDTVHAVFCVSDSGQYARVSLASDPLRGPLNLSGESEYDLVVYDAQNVELLRVGCVPLMIYDGPPGDDAGFAAAASMPPGGAMIAIESEGLLLDSVVRSPHTPEVMLIQPAGGEEFVGVVPVLWSQQDDDGDELRATVEYSADGGVEWNPIALEVAGQEMSWDTDHVAGTTEGLIRVTVSDGMNYASAECPATFTIPNKPPEVRIKWPRDNCRRILGDQVLLDAAASDLEDGFGLVDLATWESSLDGELGSGGTLIVNDLSPGEHVITCRVTDAEGVPAEDTVTLFILEDQDGDRMPSDWESLHGLDPNDANDAYLDGDDDGLPNVDEYYRGTIPTDPDTDDDTVTDGREVQFGFDPTDGEDLVVNAAVVVLTERQYNRRTFRNSAKMAIRNAAATSLTRPDVVVIEEVSTSGVSLLTRDGTTHDEKAYLRINDLGDDMVLEPGEVSGTRDLLFNNLSRRRFWMTVNVITGVEAAPAMPGASQPVWVWGGPRPVPLQDHRPYLPKAELLPEP